MAAVVVLALSWSLLENYVDLYTQGNQAETLTGRTIIWLKPTTPRGKAVSRPQILFISLGCTLFGDFEA